MNAINVTVLCFFIGTFGLTAHIMQTAEASAIPTPPKQKIEHVHLPTKCAPFYNDTTTQWIECMGVEYK